MSPSQGTLQTKGTDFDSHIVVHDLVIVVTKTRIPLLNKMRVGSSDVTALYNLGRITASFTSVSVRNTFKQDLNV